jgi:AICAR transformylase/IMP cyclohydrolase PurH
MATEVSDAVVRVRDALAEAIEDGVAAVLAPSGLRAVGR